jgi:hypothetical protein
MSEERTTLVDDQIRSAGPRAEVLEPDAGDEDTSDGDDTDETDGDDADGTDGDDSDGTDSDADGDDAS